MACGGFTCSKNALAALNVLYILVAFILIGVAAYARAVAIITDITLMGGIIACGVFLLIIAIIGLVGAVKHHQVLLFFYMIILFLLFLLQFSIACACLAMNDSQRTSIVINGWKIANSDLRKFTQDQFQCCGLDESDQDFKNTTETSHPPCGDLACCTGSAGPSTAPCCTGTYNTSDPVSCPESCETCLEAMEDPMRRATKAAGGIGLFFSFTEIIGVWLALRFRNQKDPRANPSAFL